MVFRVDIEISNDASVIDFIKHHPYGPYGTNNGSIIIITALG